MSQLQKGDRLGVFEIVGVIGAGGMGMVYRGYDSRLRREVALKVVSAEHAGSRQLRARFEQEARAASALSHPNIATIFDVGEHDGTPFIAMELVPGRSLRDLLANGPVPVRRALQVAAEIASGLAAAHSKGIVHRDLKPENIIIGSDGTAKIVDFGVAKLQRTPKTVQPDASTVADDEVRTATGLLVGTVTYMSPEQAGGEDVDFRSDQFSLGVVLYELVTGVHPFRRGTVIDTLHAIVHEDAPHIDTARNDIPQPVRWIIDRCLAKERAGRYAATEDLARDLQLLRDRFSEILRNPENTRPQVRRMPQLWVAGVVGAIALAAGYMGARWRATVPAIPSFRPLTYSGRDFHPALSPDGRIAAFASDRDGTRRIWLKDLESSSEVPLTSGDDEWPRFTADSGSVIFTRMSKRGPSIFRVPIVGGTPRRLIDNASSADASPDGQQLAFVRVDTSRAPLRSRIFLANADGSTERLLAEYPGQEVNYPRWSPDGKRIAAIAGQGDGVHMIHVIDVRTKEMKTIAVPGVVGQISSVAWAGSDSLVYVEPETIEFSSGGRLVLVDMRGRQRPLAWVPSGSVTIDRARDGRIVLEDSTLRQNLRENTIGETRRERWHTHGVSRDRQPVYSPDGRWLLFSANRAGNLDLWKLSRDEGQLARVTDAPEADWDPAFTPDSKSIIWSSARSGNLEIWIADVDGRRARQVTRDGNSAQNPTMTADGKWIVYVSFHPQKRGLWKIRTDGSGARRLRGGVPEHPEVSPDGRYVAYRDPDRDGGDVTIRVLRTEDGAEVPFTIRVEAHVTTRMAIGRLRWMPGGKRIAFIGLDAEGLTGVFAQDFVPGADTTATRVRIAGFEPDFETESFAISADGRQVTTALLSYVTSIQLAENIGKVGALR